MTGWAFSPWPPLLILLFFVLVAGRVALAVYRVNRATTQPDDAE